MKISLPNTLKTQKGFTLVELLVVIAIIAILAVIAISVFAGAQANARDGRRRADVVSIAKALEASKDFTTGVYVYDATLFGKDFPNGVNADNGVCIATSTSSMPAQAGTSGAVGSCPTPSTGYSAVSGFSTALPTGTKFWVICASLERSTTAYCVKSLGGG